MSKLFDYNNPVWRFMGRIADMFFLTLLWILGSIPFITIGASTTALYYVALKMVKNQEGYIWKSFWHSYWDNLKPATGIWCILLIVGMGLGISFRMLFQMEGSMKSMFFWGLAVLVLVYLFVFTLIFPLMARLDAGINRLFVMTFMAAVKNFSWLLLMVVSTLCILALGIFVFWPLLLFGAGSIAYIHSLILVYIVFPKYNWNY